MNSKKFVAGMIALAIVGTVSAPTGAAAATAEELAEQISALQTQLASLQGQLGTTGTTASGVANANIAACTGVTFSRNLTLGSNGNDVKCLQAILNQDATTAVAASGVGSAGFETMTFGGLTKAAVIKFQNKYAAEVLAPVGLTTGTGFVGAATRAKLNAMLTTSTTGTTGTTGTTLPAGCTSTTGYSSVTGASCASESTLPAGCTSTTGYSPVTGVACSSTTATTTSGVTQTGAEGAISVSINPTPANGVKVYEGDEKMAIYGVKIKATGSDVDVQRMTLRFNSQPYSYFSNVYLYDGDTEIASSALNSSTVSKVTATDYEITLSGFTSKVIVAKDSNKVLTVKVDVLPGISSGLFTTTSTSQTILVSTPSATAIRAVDQAGLNQYGGVAYSSTDATTYRSFTVNASQSANATLTVSVNSNSPKARNVIADSSQQIDKATVLVFDVKGTKDTLLIDQINNVVFASGTTTPDTGTTYAAAAATTSNNVYIVPTTAYLVDDSGAIIGTGTPAEVTSGAADNLYAVSFQDLNYTLAKDTTKTFSIKVDDTLGTVVAASSTDDGKMYQAAVFGSQVSGTKSNGSSLTGSASVANGNDAIVYAEGPVFTLASISTTSANKSEAASSTISATFNVQVAAVTGDVWIPKTGAFAMSIGTNGTASSTITGETYTQPSGTTNGTNAYKIPSGSTATFAVSGTFKVGYAATYDLRMDSITWAHTDLVVGSGITSSYMGGDSTWISQAIYLQ